MKLYKKIAAFVNCINESKKPKQKWYDKLENMLYNFTDSDILINSPMINMSLSNRNIIALKLPVFTGKITYIELIIKSDLQHGFDLFILNSTLNDFESDNILDFYHEKLNMEV